MPNGHCAKIVIERTGTFTQAILRANSATDLWQTIGLVTEFRRLDDSAFIGKFEPIRNIIMYGALPFTVWVSAVKTTISLHLHLDFLEWFVDLHKLMAPTFYSFFLRVNSLNFYKLKKILIHILPLVHHRKGFPR